MPHRSASRHKRKLRLRILLALGILLLIAGMYGIAKLGPSRIGDSEATQIAVQSPELVSLREEVAKLEAEFDNLLTKGGGTPDEEALATLQEAIDVQRKVVETSRGFFPDQRQLSQLRARMGEFMAAPLVEESTREEGRAVEARSAGDHEAAAKAALRAIQLQQRINQEYPASTHASAPRLTRLERFYREISAEPLAALVSAHENQTRKLILEKQFKAAAAEAAKAVAIQNEMVTLYPESPFSRPSRVREIERLAAEANAEVLSAQVRQILEEAESVAQENSAAAAQLLDKAIAIQNEINRYYSSASSADPNAVKALEQRRQDLIGRERAAAIIGRVSELDEELRQRRSLSVQSLVASINQDINGFERIYPKSTLLGGETQERLRYLQQVGGRISAIQDAVYGQLRPAPGSPGLSMLDREVSQLLFEQVAGVNPSTTRADFLPVDSTTYLDAQNFNRRLSWILARPVRLPTEDEYRKALGDLAAMDLRESSWNSSNTADRTPQSVGSSKPSPQGFFDLLGNVAEWLHVAPGAEMAPVIGGSARDNPVRLAQVPVEMRNLNDRQRNTGFRIVVELSADE